MNHELCFPLGAVSACPALREAGGVKLLDKVRGRPKAVLMAMTSVARKLRAKQHLIWEGQFSVSRVERWVRLGPGRLGELRVRDNLCSPTAPGT